MKAIFILLAAGKGARFAQKLPKQFHLLKGRPLIYWSLKNLAREPQSPVFEKVIVALPKGYNLTDLYKMKAIPQSFPWPMSASPGGLSRMESLINALKTLPQHLRQSNATVFVHDSARPLWPKEWLMDMLNNLAKHAKAVGVIPVLKVQETVKDITRKQKGDLVRMKTLPSRDTLYFSQTPQLVRIKNFLEAVQSSTGRIYLDEAQVLEQKGHRFLAMEGHPLNLKVTNPYDLKILEGLWG